jgi:hypothetical protein
MCVARRLALDGGKGVRGGAEGTNVIVSHF